MASTTRSQDEAVDEAPVPMRPVPARTNLKIVFGAMTLGKEGEASAQSQ